MNLLNEILIQICILKKINLRNKYDRKVGISCYISRIK
nr:MAG TPA: hypothetical protein [Bacteriophage sp.]